jgi:Na+/H+ antiporter NhaA
MSTDTAFLLGLVALLAPGGTRLRVRLLTLVLFDDLVALVVIATAYTSAVSLVPLLIAIALLGALAAVRYVPRRWQTQLAAGMGVAIWIALYESRVDPVISGLAIGLITSAHLPHRKGLGHAVRLMRSFREQPTPQLARTAQRGVALAISPNERLQHVLHPWTSFVIVPLFALANAGIRLNADLLSRAVSSPVTLGIVVAYVVGKPVGITTAATLALRLRIGRRALSSPVIAGAGVVAGVGFTVSLLIASIAFHGADLEDAKVGILATPILASVGGWVAFRLIGRIPRAMRTRQIAATVEDLVDLSDDIDPLRDHIRGGRNAPVTLLEYGDYECPYCGQAEPVVRALLSSFGDDLRYVWRHLPLTDVHPHAEDGAEAAEAAAAQGAFWEMHEKLFAHQDALTRRDLTRYASELGLDTDRFLDDLRRRRFAERVAEDVASADASGVVGTPGFFINGKRHAGAYDVASLTAAVRAARARAIGDYRALRDPR